MKWSYSDARTFGFCQRQWGFKRRIASATSPEPFRREAYLLSKLQTLAQWRGGIIDYIISQTVVPVLRQGRLPDRARVLRTARECYESEKAFALAHRVWAPGLKIGDLTGTFAAFYDMEYGTPPTEERLAQCWNEIEQALETLLGMRDLLEPLRTAVALVDQRTLSLPFGGMSLIARPDLIAFHRNAPPKIIDWKAHAHMQTAARGQLALYAIVLTSANPHQDFPLDPRVWNPLDVSLCEAQLLRNEVHDYQLESPEIDLAWSEVGESIVEMQRALGEEGAEWDITELPLARRAETCERCNFRRLCWPSITGAPSVSLRSTPSTKDTTAVTSKRSHGDTRQQHFSF
jgi:hypothetical protein